MGRKLIDDETVTERIGIKNAYDLFGFQKEGIFNVTDLDVRYGVIHDPVFQGREEGAQPSVVTSDP